MGLRLSIHKADKYTSNSNHQILPTCLIKDKHKIWDFIKFYILCNVNDFPVKCPLNPKRNDTCIIPTKIVKCGNYISIICTKNFI